MQSWFNKKGVKSDKKKYEMMNAYLIDSFDILSSSHTNQILIWKKRGKEFVACAGDLFNIEQKYKWTIHFIQALNRQISNVMCVHKKEFFVKIIQCNWGKVSEKEFFLVKFNLKLNALSSLSEFDKETLRNFIFEVSSTFVFT